MNFFQQLFWAQGFIPHGTSYLWDSSLIWLHALSDGLISLSYYTITLTLLYFVWRYKNLPFYGIYLWFAPLYRSLRHRPSPGGLEYLASRLLVKWNS